MIEEKARQAHLDEKVRRWHSIEESTPLSANVGLDCWSCGPQNDSAEFFITLRPIPSGQEAHPNHAKLPKKADMPIPVADASSKISNDHAETFPTNPLNI